MANEFQVSDFNNWWHEELWPTYSDMLWDLGPLWDRMEKRTPGQGYKTGYAKDLGEYILIPILVAPTQAVGWRTETGTLPTPLDPTLDQAYGNTYNFTGQIRLTDKIIAKGASHNWMSAVVMQMEGIMDTRRGRYMKHIYGEGDGALAYINEVNTGATVVDLDLVDCYGIHEGMSADFVDVSAGAVPSGASGKAVSSVTDISAEAQNIVFAQTDFSGWSGGTARNDLVVDSGSYNICMMGLDGILDTANPARGNYLNVNRSTAAKAFWKGLELSIGGDLTEDHLAQACDLSEKVIGKDGRISLIVTTQAVRRYLFDELKGDRRFNETVKGAGAPAMLYWEYGNHGTIDVLADPNCTRKYNGTLTAVEEYAYCLNEAMLYLATINPDSQWLDRDGSILHWSNGSLNWEAGFAEYIEMVCPNPRKAGIKLTGITS